jgi:hypothetical protein
MKESSVYQIGGWVLFIGAALIRLYEGPQSSQPFYAAACVIFIMGLAALSRGN